MNLRNIRKERGVLQKSLAEKIGVTSQAVCNYEKGIREPNIDTIKKIATVLDCTVDELLADPEGEK